MTVLASVRADRVSPAPDQTSSPPPPGATASAPLRWWMVLGIWALIVGLQLLIFARDIPGMRMGDPDDVLRLVQVRDLLSGQAWFDLHQYRIMAPEGVLMHWSRLVDLPLAAVILALRPLLGTANAEIAAAVIVPALTVLCTVALAMHAANRLFGCDTAVAAGIIVGLSGIVLHQMQPLRIDHHGWQIVSALGAVVGLHARDPRRGGWVLGLALAAGLTVSLEGLPLTALFIGVVAVRALLDGQWQRLGHAAVALALGTAGLFLACRGLRDMVEHCDAVSPMHIAALGWVALCGAGLAWWRPSQRPASRLVALGVLAIAAGGAAAIVALAAPQCATGAFGGLDPYVKSHWLDNVREGRPIWETTLHNAIALIGAVPLGLWACWRLIQSAPSMPERLRWVQHGLVLLGAVAVGAMVSRAMATAVGIAILPAAWQVRQWRLVAVAQTSSARRMGVNVLMLLAALPILPIALGETAWAKLGHPPADRDFAMGSLRGCDFDRGVGALAAMPATDIFAPVDIGPDILLRTHQRVVATGHHRAAAAISDVMHGFLADPEQARAYVAKRHATLVVVCTVAPEMHLYRRQAPHGLAAALLAGTPPSWLRPIALPTTAKTPSNIAAWQVVAPR
ncbi:hypothetical protein [Novosphingobium capsulatum]|uniref:hypothetical protein n=1 Tax=Novosphingobium capsulatum TaxID=13688 RepID=UPI000788E367|nr:hypothetical protein [Novosphingobium capsulatum]WQD93421.1 hypothetical protein U0041_02150 [Novosphingobium capsulatum]